MKNNHPEVEERPATMPKAPDTPQNNPWIFKMLIAVIGLCVLGLIAKIFGLF